MRNVSIIGVGQTKFGAFPETSSKELFAEASKKSLESAGLTSKDIEAVYVGNFQDETFNAQGHIAPTMVDYAGFIGKPATRFEAACASAGVATRHAIMAIAGGFYDTVLVCSVEKMTSLPTSAVTASLASALDRYYEANLGLTFPGVFALIAVAHMHRYGTTEEHMAEVAVKNHDNAVHNPMAQFRKAITIEKVLKSIPIAWPIKLFDASPISDGAAGLVLTTSDNAKKYTDTPVHILGHGQGSDLMTVGDREDITTFSAVKDAAKTAYKMAKIDPSQVDVAEVHDCFTIAEIIAMEDLGFYKPGEAAKAISDGETRIEGKIPINTSGGLKAKGHPVGASGVAQIIEIYHQLLGEANGRQVDNPKIGLTHNIGGTGASAVIHILGR